MESFLTSQLLGLCKYVMAGTHWNSSRTMAAFTLPAMRLASNQPQTHDQNGFIYIPIFLSAEKAFLYRPFGTTTCVALDIYLIAFRFVKTNSKVQSKYSRHTILFLSTCYKPVVFRRCRSWVGPDFKSQSDPNYGLGRLFSVAITHPLVTNS